MTRIKDEAEFAILKELEKEVMKLSDEEFVEQFDKEKLQHSNIYKVYILHVLKP